MSPPFFDLVMVSAAPAMAFPLGSCAVFTGSVMSCIAYVALVIPASFAWKWLNGWSPRAGVGPA